MLKGNQKIFIGIVFIIILILSVVQVSAITGRMGNAKMILYPEVNGWTYTKIDRTIYTENVNEVAINVTLRLSGGAEDFIDLIDENYILEPGESKKAAFQVKAKKVGTYKGKILVFFASTEIGHGPGVVLNSEVIVIAKKDHDYQEFVEDTPTDTSGEGNNTGSGITGGAVGVGGSPVKFLLGASTLILFAVLIGLIYLANKKGLFKKKKNGKK